MENEDEEQFCSNCKRNVFSANFATHSAFCERNIFVCKICDEPVQISEKNEHIEEYHVIVPCDLCKLPIEKWMLTKHMESCPRRPIVCEYCEADVPFFEFSEHTDFCGSRTEKCLLCQKYIMFKEKSQHDEHHAKQHSSKNIEEEIKQNKLNEVISKTSPENKASKMTSRPRHDEMTSDRGAVNRPFSMLGECRENANFVEKSKSVIRKELNPEIPAAKGASASVSQKEKEVSKHYTKCHICKQVIPWIDINVHVPTCASSAGKCSLCGDDVPDYAMKEHMKEHSQRRYQQPSSVVPENLVSSLKPIFGSDRGYAAKSEVDDAEIKCPYCSQKCSRDRISEHVRECSKNVYDCPLCSAIVPEKDKNRHENSDCRMIHGTDESTRPQYSSQNSFEECPLCSEAISQENREKHLTFECKKLFEIYETHNSYKMRYEPSYFHECPYCSEKMPDKDKERHEKFECKVLIANYTMNSNEKSESYAEVTKKTCKGSCQCHQKPNSCHQCKKRIPIQKMPEKFPCLHCNEPIDPALEEFHLKKCPAMNNSIKNRDLNSGAAQNSTSTNYDKKGAIPKFTNIREMMIPRSAKCLYCDTSLNADIVKYHEEECLYRPFSCHSCSKEVILKDCKSHKCKGKKGKGKNQKTEQQTAEPHKELGILKRLANFLTPDTNGQEVNKEHSAPYSQNHFGGYKHAAGDVGTIRNSNMEYFTKLQNQYGSYGHAAGDVDTIPNPSFMETCLLPCEFCEKTFPASDLVLHMTGCQPHLVSYAVPESLKNSEQITHRPDQECSSLPSKLSTENKDAVPSGRNKKIWSTTVRSPLFSENTSFSPPSRYAHRESDVEPGEFLPTYKSSSRHNEYPKNNSEDHKTKDSSEPISAHSDAAIDIDRIEKTTYLHTNEMRDIKEQEKQVSARNSPDDSETTYWLNFINDDTESDDKYASLSDENRGKVELKNSKTEACNYFLDTQEECQGDLPVSEKKNIDQEINTLKFINNSVQNEKEPAPSRQMANFRFGAYKPPNEDNAHRSVQPKKVYEEPENLYKLKTTKCFESTNDQEEHISSSRQMAHLKTSNYESLAFSEGNFHQNILSKKSNEEPERMHKQMASEYMESSQDQRQYLYNKYLADLTDGTHESTVSSYKEVHFPVETKKFDEVPEMPQEQKTEESSHYTGEVAEYESRCLVDLRLPTTLSDEGNEHLILSGKNRTGPEKLCHQKTTSNIEKTMSEKEYILKFRQHLLDFKFGKIETKPRCSEDDIHVMTSEKNYRRHEKSAFKIEPAESVLKETKHPIHPAMKERKALEGLDERIAKLRRGVASGGKKDDVTEQKKWRDTSTDSSGSD